MDRFIRVKGTLENGAISVGNNGVEISYNARGDRKTAIYGKNTVTGQDAHTESYEYTNDGDLKTVTTGGVLSASRKTDVLGRLIQSDEYPAAGGAAFQTRVLYYDLNDSREDYGDMISIA